MFDNYLKSFFNSPNGITLMNKRFAVLALATLSLNAHAGFWDEFGKVATVLGAVTGTPSTSTTTSTGSYPSTVKAPPFAPITPEQVQQISRVVIANTGDADLNRAILEAKPNLEGFLKLASCQTEESTLFSGRFLSPSGNRYMVRSVIPTMKYKSLNHCLTVSSLGNWKIESRNRLDYNAIDKISFNVTYFSDDSQESKNVKAIIQREPDGQWYFLEHPTI